MTVQMGLMVFCVLVFVFVSVLMLGVAWRHHRGADDGKTNFHRSVSSELGWTLTPLLMTALLAWPAVRSVLGH